MFKLLIVAVLIAILISLFYGAVFLARDQGKDNRVVTSLTFRISLSVALIVLVLVGYFTGQISPHGLG